MYLIFIYVKQNIQYHIIICKLYILIKKKTFTEWKSEIPGILWKVARWKEWYWIKNVNVKDWNTWFPTFFLSLFSALLWALKWWSVLRESEIETINQYLIGDFFSFLSHSLIRTTIKPVIKKTGALWGLK